MRSPSSAHQTTFEVSLIKFCRVRFYQKASRNSVELEVLNFIPSWWIEICRRLQRPTGSYPAQPTSCCVASKSWRCSTSLWCFTMRRTAGATLRRCIYCGHMFIFPIFFNQLNFPLLCLHVRRVRRPFFHPSFDCVLQFVFRMCVCLAEIGVFALTQSRCESSGSHPGVLVGECQANIRYRPYTYAAAKPVRGNRGEMYLKWCVWVCRCKVHRRTKTWVPCLQWATPLKLPGKFAVKMFETSCRIFELWPWTFEFA